MAMDPQSLAFTPQRDSIWHLNSVMKSLQDTQQEHSERLIRLERRHDDDARVKSVWDSPFPGVLGGTSQRQTPSMQPIGVDFATFDDDQSSSMVRSLHLDAEDEPRRFGPMSRANSVRFDESANQGTWAHTTRSSVDFIPRASSGLGGAGGHPLFERTTSYKSDGRHSSAGQSAMSGRANSFGVEISSAVGIDSRGLAPGLFILGSVPAVIRCWLDTNFRHDSLLYAAACSGSYKSFLNVKLVESLGLMDQVNQDINGNKRIRLPVYLPEAVPHPSSSSRSSSPATQLPTLTVDFNVVDLATDGASPKTIQIILGSDTLRSHNADILFSSNSLAIYDDERSKLSVPLVRPENEDTFKGLRTTSSRLPASRSRISLVGFKQENEFIEPDSSRLANVPRPMTSGEAFGANTAVGSSRAHGKAGISPEENAREEEAITLASSDSMDETPLRTEEQRQNQKPSLTQIITSKSETKDSSDEGLAISSTSRTSSTPAVWNSWRRESAAPNLQGDWATARATSGSYQRPHRDQGMKVLRPTRQISRSGTARTSTSPGQSQSRYFDDGKRRSGTIENSSDPHDTLKRTQSGDSTKTPSVKENVLLSSTSSKSPNTVNPIGGASAFGWLNSGRGK